MGKLIYGSFITEYLALPFAPKLHVNWVPDWPSEAKENAPDLDKVTQEYSLNAIIGKANLESDWDAFQKTLKDMGIEQITTDFNDRYQTIKP